MKKCIGSLLILLLLYGCAQNVTHVRESWTQYNLNELSKVITIGKTSKAEIYKIFGTPTTITSFSSGIVQWKYFFSRKLVYDTFRHLGTYGVMDRVICFNFNKEGIVIEYSHEEPVWMREEGKNNFNKFLK